jgi:hypothetical protein
VTPARPPALSNEKKLVAAQKAAHQAPCAASMPATVSATPAATLATASSCEAERLPAARWLLATARTTVWPRASL